MKAFFDTNVYVTTSPELPGTLSRGMDAAVVKEWLDEAERRDEAMDRGAESGVPAQEVLRRIERRREWPAASGTWLGGVRDGKRNAGGEARAPDSGTARATTLDRET